MTEGFVCKAETDRPTQRPQWRKLAFSPPSSFPPPSVYGACFFPGRFRGWLRDFFGPLSPLSPDRGQDPDDDKVSSFLFRRGKFLQSWKWPRLDQKREDKGSCKCVSLVWPAPTLPPLSSATQLNYPTTCPARPYLMLRPSPPLPPSYCCIFYCSGTAEEKKTLPPLSISTEYGTTAF